MLKNPINNAQPTGIFHGYYPGHRLFGDNNQLIVLNSDEREKLWRRLNIPAWEYFTIDADKLKSLNGEYYPFGSLYA
jgi:hypothetical protein